MSFKLLSEFEGLFSGRQYLHRSSTQGDRVAIQMYEDLLDLARSSSFVAGIRSGRLVVNAANRVQGIRSRRGDATFGEIVPGVSALATRGFAVPRGPVAEVEIGVEVKILAKAMIKQIDRVISDLSNQVTQFKRGGTDVIAVGIVGVNHAAVTTSYEGTRSYLTDGSGGNPHPAQEAAEAERRLLSFAEPRFDAFLVLKYRATNVDPYAFEWVNRTTTERDYGAILLRISREFDRRHPLAP